MKWAALILWIITAGGGFALLGIWLARGGPRQNGARRIKTPLIFAHFLLAAGGLVLWIIYVANDSETIAWIAFAALLVVALLGFTMFGIWLSQRRGAAPDTAVAARPAEQHFPVPIVVLHGLLAATTLVLVLLSAAGVGGS